VSYFRLSLTTPREGALAEVERIERELLAFFRTRPGFQRGFRLTAEDRVGRATVWNSEADADHAANQQHTLSLRSRLMQLVEEDMELAFEGEEILPV